MSLKQYTDTDSGGAPTTDDTPTDTEVADTLGVDARELRAFVDRLEEPRTAAVLGWATASPGSIDLVEAWLAARTEVDK